MDEEELRARYKVLVEAAGIASDVERVDEMHYYPGAFDVPIKERIEDEHRTVRHRLRRLYFQKVSDTGIRKELISIERKFRELHNDEMERSVEEGIFNLAKAKLDAERVHVLMPAAVFAFIMGMAALFGTGRTNFVWVALFGAFMAWQTHNNGAQQRRKNVENVEEELEIRRTDRKEVKARPELFSAQEEATGVEDALYEVRAPQA